MGADNYENLGFQVKIDGAETAVNRLDDIIDRLERIQKLNKNVGGRNKKGGKSGGLATNGQIIGDDLAKAQAKGQQDNYKLALKYARQLAQITDPAYKKVYDIGLQVKAYKKQIETSNYLSASANEEANKSTERNTTAQNKNTNAVNKNKTAIKNKVNAQKQEEKQTKRNTKSLTAYISKLTSVVVIARRIGHFVGYAIQESANYVENLNLFAVAYGDVYQETLKWALDLADGFGLASNEVLRFAGTFRQLSTSLGLVEDTANSVSQTVTQLGYDISALFNTSVENAMEKLQSGLFSGNVRPLRSYGIDISQNQIDALFETNQALASLSVNARNLSQSDKVLARLIITLRDGSNAFGTMNREINTLQSQIRILQGSFANFKLAIGDLVQEPLRQSLVYVNGFIIAMTNIIRLFKPLKTTDENNVFTSTAMGAEEASEAVDNLNGQLADFDKFNVLGGQSQSGSQLAVTEALTAELEKQQKLYQEQVDAMSKVQNEATLAAEKILSWFVVLDENGKFVQWTDEFQPYVNLFESFGALLKDIAPIALEILPIIADILSTTMQFLDGLGLLEPALYAIVSIKMTGWFLGIKSPILAVSKALIKEFIPSLAKAKISAGNVAIAVTSMIAAYSLADSIINSFDGEARKTASGVMVLVGAIMAVTAAIVAMNTSISWGTMLPVLLAGVGTAIAGVKGLMTDVEDISRSAHADGGYTNANLIMTHENGKREWVGKAAGSSAIVNDTQMSDIMEVAVAKGVYNALSARSAMGSNVPTNETIVVKIGEEAVFNAVRKTARRQGRDFANV